MITGAHSVIYSTDAEADRAFLRDVLKFTNVDVGNGWLIFGLPQAEVAVHRSEKNDLHEFYLMCDDVNAFVAEMISHQIACDPVQDQRYRLVHAANPSGRRQSWRVSAPACEAEGNAGSAIEYLIGQFGRCSESQAVLTPLAY